MLFALNEQDFPFSETDRKYLFNVGSSLKPTQMRCAPGGLNQIPGWAVLEGDIRVTPSYDIDVVQRKLEQYVQEIDVTTLPSFGYSKFDLPTESLRGTLEFKFMGGVSRGVAVNMDSFGYKALYAAVAAVRGEAKPFSLTGSLPIIRDLQDSGFDVQICGFGRMDAYHANNEVCSKSGWLDTRTMRHFLQLLIFCVTFSLQYAQISEFQQGAQVIFKVISSMNSA